MRYFHKILTTRNNSIDVEVDGPTLVRLNKTFNLVGGAQLFAPTTGGMLWLSAWPYGEIPPPGTGGNDAQARAWRGTGPLIYLPHAGRWTVNVNISTFGGALLPAIGTMEFSLLAMSPEVAAVYLSSPPSSFHVSGNFTVPNATGLNVFAAAGVDLSTLGQAEPVSWHSLTAFAIHINQSPVTGFTVAIGRTAAAAVGGVIAGFGRRVWTWPEIAAQTVFVFNNSGGNVDVNIEAHFL